MDTDELRHVSIENANGTLYFFKKDDNWVYEEDENFPLDEDTFENLVSILEEVSAVRTLEGAGSPDEYGLSKPAVTVTAETGDGVKQELYIGRYEHFHGRLLCKVTGWERGFIPLTEPQRRHSPADFMIWSRPATSLSFFRKADRIQG